MENREYRLRLRIDELMHERDLLTAKLERSRRRNKQRYHALWSARRQRDVWASKYRGIYWELQGYRVRDKRRRKAIAA